MTAGFVIACLVAVALMCAAVTVLVHERNQQLAADLAKARAENRRLAASAMLANLRLADATGHPSASVLPFERRTR